MDIFSAQKRSKVMAGIKGTDTHFEVALRSWFFKKGLRFRKNDRSLIGKPDIVFPRYRTIVFVHGCFWHGHQGCRFAYIPKTRTDFWLKKISNNQDRDDLVTEKLKLLGWNVLIIWECDLKRTFEQTAFRIYNAILSNNKSR